GLPSASSVAGGRCSGPIKRSARGPPPARVSPARAFEDEGHVMRTFCQMRRAWLIATAAAVVVFLARPDHAAAGTRTWTGGAWPDTNMSTPANWVAGVVPGAGDDLVFPATATHQTVTPNLGGVRFTSLVFNANPGANYTLQAGTLTILNGIQVGSGEA